MQRRQSTPVCVANFETLAATKAEHEAMRFWGCGAEREVTLRDNQQAFDRIRLRPRVLTGRIHPTDLSTTILGSKVKLPIGVSPMGYQRLAWSDGELSTARAAEELGVCYTMGTVSTTSMESIMGEAPHGLKWFQLYILSNRDLTEIAVRQAEKLGMKAIVVTVDLPVLGTRWATKGIPLKLPPGVELKLFDNDVFSERGADVRGPENVATHLDTSLSWEHISWLKTITTLPIVVKGIMTREDALLAVQHGVSAVWVSNHGGRQLDGVFATIDALPEVVEAVDGRIEVYVDGGVRTGTDVLKALALGARAVFIGRPVMWGLAYKGSEGIKDVFNILRDELKTALMLSGCGSVQNVSRSLIAGKSTLSRL